MSTWAGGDYIMNITWEAVSLLSSAAVKMLLCCSWWSFLGSAITRQTWEGIYSCANVNFGPKFTYWALFLAQNIILTNKIPLGTLWKKAKLKPQGLLFIWVSTKTQEGNEATTPCEMSYKWLSRAFAWIVIAHDASYCRPFSIGL